MDWVVIERARRRNRRRWNSSEFSQALGWSLVLALIFATAGCDRPPAGGASAGQEEGIKHRDLASLPPVEAHLDTLDDDRLQVSSPQKWTVLPRSRTYLVAFAPSPDNELPRIGVSAEGPPPGSPAELTEEDVWQFAARQDTALQEGGRSVVEPNLPLALGDTLFVRHVRLARQGPTAVAIQSLQTIRGGRLYTVELVAPVERELDYGPSLVKWRDYGYAVAANLKFALPGEKFDPVAESKTRAEAAAAEAKAKAKAAADKAALDKSATDKTATDKTAADKSGADKSGADKAAAPKAAVDKAKAPEARPPTAKPVESSVKDTPADKAAEKTSEKP